MAINKNNNNGRKGRRPWIFIALTIILAVVIGIILYQSLSKSAVEAVSLSKLADHIKEAAKSTEDKIYVDSLKYDQLTNLWTWTFNNGTKELLFKSAGTEAALKEVLLPNTSGTIGELVNTATKFKNEAGLDVNNGLSFVEYSQQNPWLAYFLRFLPTLLLIGFFIFMFKLQSNAMSGGGGILSEKNPAQKIISDKKFVDIAGNKEAIEEIKEIVDYLKNPKKYDNSGARMPKGILLGGPPGTGKTLLAKATAGEANVPFYFISASNFVEMYVGLGAKRVRQVINEARKNAPSIIFIDELDAIGRTRGSGIGGGHDEREQTLNQLLVEMDGITGNKGLLFFAATNRTDVLDPALIRPGRFDRTITVGLPDVKEREEILKLHAKGKRFDKRIEFKNIAKRTPGYSGAQLENVINEATLLSVREDSEFITLPQIDEAIDRVMAGPAKKSRTITLKELTSVAYHEAGHAVVGIKTPGANKVQKITIIPRGQAGGYNLMMPEEEKYNMSKKELLAIIASFMGGRAAESIIYGEENVSTGASDDISKATNIARRMVTEYGMSDLGAIKFEEQEGNPFLGKTLGTNKSFSNQLAHEIDLEIKKIIDEALAHAHRTIKENLQLLELIKEELLEKETIVSEEIEYIAQNLKRPPSKEEEVKAQEKTPSLDELINESWATTEEKK
ncbi:ATP-dependent zinc metalloprotease FtsH [Mycoplasmopsis alligatoris]|uniref:ATP-dependent zinc metalloprotease FtsH n=1 Tax=Mycoplasmopsis alligatoris A21JP2 TaxID=747682 RepID=D4XWH9_9BACT|nr:ATP-dependent zinc metalloprotease FtsH [Mycoplasmopsis alligatoris]EFF41362.1 ATP-dependent metallopeptidase HflB [Mycoplasmopsis alligatoris A21JP2]